ncbi:MAG: hypothetical protein HYS81_03045 [Candidatus Aenigmatarchaeota archaeon]|nr:MAG: hypothetical protein HYS81_03045 [Candidatus Aenigmarchaeota archaeon]
MDGGMMDKGQLFTVVAFFLVFSLVALSAAFSNVNLETKRDANVLTDATKLAYAFDTAKYSMQLATGVNVTKNSTRLTLRDDIDRTTSYQTFLSKLESFVNSKFEDRTLTVDFVDTSGGAMDWNQVTGLDVVPFNITYVYPIVGGDIEIRSFNDTALDHLERMDVDISMDASLVANSTFWAPENDCSPPGSPPSCLPIRIVIRGSNGVTKDSGESNLDLSQQSVSTHLVQGGAGNVKVTIGRSPSTDSRFILIETSGVAAHVNTIMTFDTEGYRTLNPPARLRVFDAVAYIEGDV